MSENLVDEGGGGGVEGVEAGKVMNERWWDIVVRFWDGWLRRKEVMLPVGEVSSLD